LKEINKIDSLSDEGKEKFLGASFDDEYFSNFEFTEELSISSVIKGPVKNLILYTVIYFMAMMILYFVLFRKGKTSIKEKIFLIVKYLLLWIIFVLAGLITAATGLSILSVLALALVFGLFSLLYKDQKRKRSLIMNAIMLIIVLVSVI